MPDDPSAISPELRAAKFLLGFYSHAQELIEEDSEAYAYAGLGTMLGSIAGWVVGGPLVGLPVGALLGLLGGTTALAAKRTIYPTDEGEIEELGAWVDKRLIALDNYDAAFARRQRKVVERLLSDMNEWSKARGRLTEAEKQKLNRRVRSLVKRVKEKDAEFKLDTF